MISIVSGCAFYRPHSLVGTNIRPTADAMTGGSRRVEAEVCGNRLFGIPFGPEPRVSVLMTELQKQVPSAVGFEDIEIDEALILYPFFYQSCVLGSATPLFSVTKPRAKPPAAAPPAETPPPPTPTSPGDDPFAQ